MAIFRIPINLTWAGNGSPGVNVFHVRDDSWPASSGLDTALTVLSSAYADLGNATTGVLAAGTAWSLGDIVELEGNEYVQPGAAAFTAGTAGGTAGLQVAAAMIVCGWRTTLAARRGMGRTFIGPLRGTQQPDTNGTPTTAQINAVKAFGQRILDHNNTAGTANFGIYGYDTAPVKNQARPENAGRVIRDITAFRVRDQYAVLRSRRD